MHARVSASSIATLSPPSAGLDRLLLSSQRLPWRIAQGLVVPRQVPVAGYRVGPSRPTRTHINYRRITRITSPYTDAPLIEVFTQPRRQFRPAAQVAVRARPGHYIDDLGLVIAVITELEGRLAMTFRVAEIEPALDFPGDTAVLRALQHQAYVRRVLAHVQRGDTRYWGNGGSAREIRSYLNTEAATSRGRFEVVMRAPVLRTLHLAQTVDLRAKTWIGYVDRALQFLAPRTPRRAHGQALATFLADVQARGVTTALGAVRPRDRSRLRRSLRPSVADLLARDALADLRRRLKP